MTFYDDVDGDSLADERPEDYCAMCTFYPKAPGRMTCLRCLAAVPEPRLPFRDVEVIAWL